MSQLTKPLAVEFFASATLIFIGCGSVVIAGLGATLPAGALPIALAFGLTVIGLAYAFGPVSGCHINPSATIALWLAGRFPAAKVVPYIISQILGGIAGAFALWLIATGRSAGYDVAVAGLGQNGWGAGYLGEYSLTAAFTLEFLMSFLLMAIILWSTAEGANTAFAAIAIGSSVTVIILTMINVTGVSLNPMRSLAPAIFVGGKALSQVWLFFVAPTLGMALAALVYKALDARA
jgi:aquaporin Z